jgi:hypothetical protein
MSGIGQSTRWLRQFGLAATIGATIVLAMLGQIGSALASPRALPAASLADSGSGSVRHTAGQYIGRSGTHTDWAPVPYRNAQLSVPGSWLVEAPQQLACGFSQADGMIFVGISPDIPKGMGCGLTSSLAWILPAGRIPHGIGSRTPTAVIHGFSVYRLRSAKGSVLYLVPELGVRVGARGLLARRVLATLTRSPLSVVLRRGPVGPVPANWIWRHFGGLRFAAPRSWSLLREDQWATCGTGLVPQTLLLLDATRPPLALPCPAQLPTASADQALPGLAVVTGKYASESVGESYTRCQVRRGVQICLSTVTGQGGPLGGVLIFSASKPHRHALTFFLLGLSGSGANARAIFGSIRLAPR